MSVCARCCGWISLCAVLGLFVTNCTGDRSEGEAASTTGVVSILGGDAPQGFEPVTPGHEISFPPDHGPHFAQQIEWWYTTMNLETDPTSDQPRRRFGVEVTFFRFGLDPAADPDARGSDWATRDLYMAHFAVTDQTGRRFRAFERFTRGALALAGAEADPWRVWNESWSLTAANGSATPFPIELRAADRDEDGAVEIAITLTGDAPPILQGAAGFSRKGPEEGSASYYYSYPSLRATGALTIAGVTHTVGGTAWFDHEWSTSVLEDDLVGWDWFALQFEDGARLMVYELRRPDGTRSPFGAGTWISPDRSVRALAPEDFTVTVLDRWRSSITDVEYPARWNVEVFPLALECTVSPVLPDQELRLSTRYYEGAVDARGTISGSPISGWGYVELVGYGEGSTSVEDSDSHSNR